MRLAELEARKSLRANTQTFVTENADAIARRMTGALPVIERKMRRLKGAEGLLLKKRFLDATDAWEKFFWSRIAEHRIDEKLELEDALRMADEDLLLLSSALGPL